MYNWMHMYITRCKMKPQQSRARECRAGLLCANMPDNTETVFSRHFSVNQFGPLLPNQSLQGTTHQNPLASVTQSKGDWAVHDHLHSVSSMLSSLRLNPSQTWQICSNLCFAGWIIFVFACQIRTKQDIGSEFDLFLEQNQQALEMTEYP